MRDEVYAAVQYLIEDFNLHAWMRVKLTPLEALFPVRHADLGSFRIMGSCVPPKDGLLSGDNPAKIVLDSGLDDYTERIAYAHEIGHGLMGHAGDFVMADSDHWFIDKAEREAWEVAALLLVPYDAITRYRHISVIALACEVPEHLVSLAVSCYLAP
ncbi:MAG: ImmA/IrrE family metallo-endopeptidase [Thermomicrobiales bacterium]